MENVKDKVVIITGASSGIGNETAKLLASKGTNAVPYAVSQPDNVDVSDIVVRPRGEA